MEKIFKPGDIVDSHHIWQAEGRFFLGWISDESTNRKGTRIFEGQKEISAAEFDELKAEWSALAEKQAADKAVAENKAAIKAAYFSALPVEIAGFKRGCCGRAWELEDDYGNYVLSLPTKAALENWSVAALATWIEEQTAEGWGE